MPDFLNLNKNISFQILFQLIAGLLFLGIGIYILSTNFNNNYVLVGTTRVLFGSILCLYGTVRLIRIYNQLKHQKDDEERFTD